MLADGATALGWIRDTSAMDRMRFLHRRHVDVSLQQSPTFQLACSPQLVGPAPYWDCSSQMLLPN